MAEVVEEKPISANEVKELPMLDPDHPLLERFQRVLKEQLLQQIENLKAEVDDYEISIKKKNQEKEEIGVQVYEIQQIFCKQQKVLEETIDALQNTRAARECLEQELDEKKTKQREEREKLIQIEKRGLELQNENDAMNLLIQQMSEWENKVESNISVNQRIAEKTRKDNLRLAEEKRKQDAIMYRLMKEVWRLESELETMDMQLRVKESEREEMAQTVALGNTNIEALQAEYRCLMHSWNSVVVAVANRDKVLGCLREEECKEDYKYKAILAEIEQVKKLIKVEMSENENLTSMKHRINFDINNLKTKTSEEMVKYSDLSKQMHELQSIVDQTNKDIDNVMMEQRRKETMLSVLTKDFNIISNKKYQLEQDIIKSIETLSINDKSAISLTKALQLMKQKNRRAQINLLEIENKNSQTMAQIEKEKFVYEENEETHRTMLKECKELESEADDIAAKQAKLDLAIRKKQAELDILNTRLEKLRIPDQNSGSPQDLKIIALEKSVDETEEKIKDLQSYWLREQRNLLSVSRDRQQQIHDKNLLKKQVMILEQKNFKISDQLEQMKNLQEKVDRNIHKLQNQVVILCDMLFKKKDKKGDLDKTNDILKNDYDMRLRDAEMECLSIEGEIMEIENEKVNLSKDLIEINREILEWEKKVKLTRETKENMKQESSGGGELSTMKAEVHRMKMRYSQLQKAQEKLIADMEYCVIRRSSMYTLTEGLEKKTGENKSKMNYLKRIDDMKNKIKQVENQITKTQENISDSQVGENQFKSEISAAEGEIEEIKKEMEDLKETIEATKTDRQLNFEMLLMKQKRLSMYNELAKGRTPYTVYRTEEQLTVEYAKEKELNNKLCRILENLISDFPNYYQQLLRIFNTLRLPNVVC